MNNVQYLKRSVQSELSVFDFLPRTENYNCCDSVTTAIYGQKSIVLLYVAAISRRKLKPCAGVNEIELL
jgi:hypothetical protein